MSELSHKQFLHLQAMDRTPIALPAEIYFGGNEILQKTPGAHHLPQYRQTGTYHLPQLKEWRKRVAMDRAKRLLNMKMSETELRNIGGVEGVKEGLAEHGLGISGKQFEIAKMNATSLELEGEAKKMSREQDKKAMEEKLGKKLDEIKADESPPDDPIAAALKASAAKVTGDNDLSSLTSEEDKDKEAKKHPSESTNEDVSFENLI